MCTHVDKYTNSSAGAMPNTKKLPGAHFWVHGFAHSDSVDPSKATDEAIPSNHAPRKWCSKKQNRAIGCSSSLKRGEAVDELICNPSSALHAMFKAELAKHKLSIESWQRCIEVPASAPPIFQGFAPVLDCLCIETKSKRSSGSFVPIEVKACRPRKLKRRTSKDAGLRRPFDNYADNWGLRHQLQLCLQNAALGNVKPRGFVAYVDTQKPSVTLVKLNKDLWAIAIKSA